MFHERQQVVINDDGVEHVGMVVRVENESVYIDDGESEELYFYINGNWFYPPEGYGPITSGKKVVIRGIHTETPKRCEKCGRTNPIRVEVEEPSRDSFERDEYDGWFENVYFIERGDGWECSNWKCKHLHIKACLICTASVMDGVFCEKCYKIGYCTDCLVLTGNGDTSCRGCARAKYVENQ